MKTVLDMYLRSTKVSLVSIEDTSCVLPACSQKIFIYTLSSRLIVIHICNGILYRSQYVEHRRICTYKVVSMSWE